MRGWLAAAAAAVLLAGCGTALAKPAAAPVRAHTVAAPAVSIRARALALAWRLVGELSPPPGTRTVHLATLPWPLNQPQAPLQPGWVRVTETLEAPAKPASEWTGLLARTPLHDTGGLTPARQPARYCRLPHPVLTLPRSPSRWCSSPTARS
jgi:hypothetical protein